MGSAILTGSQLCRQSFSKRLPNQVCPESSVNKNSFLMCKYVWTSRTLVNKIKFSFLLERENEKMKENWKVGLKIEKYHRRNFSMKSWNLESRDVFSTSEVNRSHYQQHLFSDAYACYYFFNVFGLSCP